MSQDTRVYMRRLEKIAMDVGVNISGKEEPETTVDTSGMSKYERGRFQCAQMMKQVREDTKTLDEMQGPQVKITRKAEVSNRLKRNIRQMKAESQSLKKEAAKEGRLDDFSDLVRHMKKTEAMYKQRFRSSSADDDDAATSATALRTFDSIPSYNTGGDQEEALLDPAQDEEFQQYFLQIQRRNEAIDQGLIQLHAGVRRVMVSAQETGDEVALQNAMLDSVNDKAERISHQLRNINAKLKDTLTKLEKDKYCCYFICLLVLLGVLGVILTQTGVVGHKK
eukprot:TRINITY_DN4491_c0_g1_i1.p1 TRINITY_DN4491_c0_g1~~TRINITY_DN4491_c0_g1_i1.p1  ORF type:complete len:280 (+),score=66.58 TRINITY_DN4491_c0_g1_i1:88-927(+)